MFKLSLIILIITIVLLLFSTLQISKSNIYLQQISASEPRFYFDGQNFILDGNQYLIRGGEIHYARIPHQYWRQRIQMIKAMGLNSLSCYIMWNYHETQKGVFDFESPDKNLKNWLQIAKEEGMRVLIRPGPYVCAEWDFGGQPYYLNKDTSMEQRSSQQQYIDAITPYIQKVAKIIAPFQINNDDGPIIMLQIENEYGYYGNNNDYPKALQKIWEDTGLITVPYYTADKPLVKNLDIGHVPGGALGGNAATKQSQFDHMTEVNPNVPQLSSETYSGWLTHWGEKWATKSVEKVVDEFQWLLENNKSFAMYMAHGGTNFGFWAGSNCDIPNIIQPDVTSYDYDCPINEQGSATEKYLKLRELFQKYSENTLPDIPAAIPMTEFDETQVDFYASLWNNLPQITSIQKQPSCMEDLDQAQGYVLYETTFDQKQGQVYIVDIPKLHDYANIYLNEVYFTTITRTKHSFTFTASQTNKCTIQILVQAFGHVNFGHQWGLKDRKGIDSIVTINGKEQEKWYMYSLPFDYKYISSLNNTQKDTNKRQGMFFKTNLILNEAADVYIDMSEWQQGFIYVNGYNLGMFWNKGPQQRLYCPGVWLNVGDNEVIIFDFHEIQAKSIKGVKYLYDQ